MKRSLLALGISFRAGRTCDRHGVTDRARPAGARRAHPRARSRRPEVARAGRGRAGRSDAARAELEKMKAAQQATQESAAAASTAAATAAVTRAGRSVGASRRRERQRVQSGDRGDPQRQLRASFAESRSLRARRLSGRRRHRAGPAGPVARRERSVVRREHRRQVLRPVDAVVRRQQRQRRHRASKKRTSTR